MQEQDYIGDFTLLKSGYGFSPSSGNLYNYKNLWGESFKYSSKFALNEGAIIKMTLDMSNEDKEHTTLSYEFGEGDIEEKIHKDISNIAFDDIDKLCIQIQK